MLARSGRASMAAESHLEVRDHLLQALQQDLVGPMRDDEVLPQKPSRWYLTGFLVPRNAPESQRFDPTATEQVSTGGEGQADDDRDDEAAVGPQPFFASSLGLSVVVPPGVSTLAVTASWGEYRLLDASEAAEVQAANEENLEPGDVPEKRRSSWWQRSGRTSQTLTVPVEDRRHKLQGGEDLKVEVRVRPAHAPGLPPGAKVASIFLVNDKEALEGAAADSRSLYQVELQVACEQGLLGRPDAVHELSDDPDERRNDLQFRDHGEWAVGHGVSVEAVQDDDGAVRCVRTTWLPRARVRRMAAETVKGVPLEMDALSTIETGAALKAAMEPLVEAYGAWIDSRQVDGLSERRKETAQFLRIEAHHALGRIRAGLDLLEADPQAFRAFQLTNQAMALSSRKARPDLVPRWRLFQLAFFLLNVRGVVHPEHADRCNVELLFFPTGGGKTEAYFGVAAFSMLLRRLRHGDSAHGGAGVTVLLRYTLRLLTLDQLGRAATLTCALEMLRIAYPDELGLRRFSVGLWVGKSATPNKLKDAQRQTRDYKRDPNDPRKAPPVPLVGCPWCAAAFTPESFHVEVDARNNPSALRVGCSNLDCDFHFDATGDRGLPLVVVDEQVYRELPTFVIGTVDKFALMPWRGESGVLFGRVRAVDGGRFYGNHENAPVTATALPGGLPPPELIIQDELHLITGPLGTMVGLYETAVEHLCRDAQRHPAKLIASTATARRAKEQIKALYARSQVSFFPPQGPDAGDTFFAKTDAAEDKTRLYVGVAAPGRSMKAVMVRVYSTLLSAAYRDWYNAAQAGLKGEKNPADTYTTLVAYFNTLRALGGAQRLVKEEVAPRSSRLSGRHPVQDRRSNLLKDRLLGFDVLELTSRQSTDDIRKAKGRLESAYDAKNKNDVLLASSMISVGVDIPRLGLMVMNGQPRTVAEYIQATSRVGRNTPGLVVTLHNLFRPRDRSHFERFTAFHDAFYRNVEASSVTPFSSRAIDRGLAGVTVALARHGHPQLTPPMGAEQIDRVPPIPAEVAEILAARVGAHASGMDDLAEHVRQRVLQLFSLWSQSVHALAGKSVHLPYSPWETKAPVTLLSTVVDGPITADPRLEHFRAPTSMRSVEETVHFWINNRLAGDEA